MSATDNEVKGTEVPETTEETGNNGVVDVRIALPNKTVVQIPSVFVGESLASFKQALLDYQECAAFTCYSLHLRELVAQDGTKTEVDVACNDFTELASVMEPTTASCMFELIPGEYNVKKVHDQLKRTNDMMLNPPTTKGLINVPANKKKTDSKANDSKKSTTANDSNPAMPKTEDLFKNIEFGNFYGEVLYRTGNVEAVTQSGRMPQNKAITDAVKSVFASGWNPPPPQRKVRGDLLYIEVVTANEGTVYITAVPSGFYVNKCNRSHFDPSPATNHCFSHELFDTLLKVSPSLKTAWNTVVASTRSPSSSEAEPATPLDVTAWMFSQGRGHLTTEGAMPKIQWNAYNTEAYKNFLEGTEASARPSENAHHAYNLFRTQQDLTNLQGVEELGAPREWNDEIQSIRALKATDGSEKIMKAKLEYKVLSEFAAACRATAVAITEGLIAPLSLGDPSQSDIYVYNGIFFSKAEDSKDSFKICNGDEAYKKCTARELQNQRTIRSLEIEGVGMILCAIIDYKGQRIIGQSIIPGIFAQGENVARLMYGILDKEKLLTVKNSSLKVMQAVAEKLFIPTRNTKLYPFGEPAAVPAAVEDAGEETKTAGMLDEAQASPIKVDETDNVVEATATSTPHCGPIEGKVLRGSDGRDYVLEVMRLTPRDANYVSGEKGTGKVTTLDKTDKDLAVTYILRPELISIYVQRKMNLERQKVMMEAAAKQKQLLADKAPKTVEGAAAEATEDEKKETETPALDEETMRTLTEEYTAKMKEITIASLGLEVNPNCFLDFEFDVDAAVVKKDEDTARELATFLWDVVLPAVTKQVRDGDIQVRDNAAMVKLLHRNGVNMRYLGALLNLAVTEEKEDEDLLAQGKQKVHAMPLFWREMLTIEVIARAVKYVLNSYFKQSAAVFAAPAQTVASVLNHVLSLLVPSAAAASVATEASANTATEVSKKSNKKKKGGKGVETAATVAVATKADEKALLFPVPDSATNCDDVLRLIQETVASRFCFDLPLSSAAEADLENSKKFLKSRMSALSLLRRICQVCGIQIATRKYNFSSATPLAAADVLGLYPIVKSCEPEVLLSEFNEMLDSSVNFQQEGNFAYAYEMAQQALGTITQITGPYHMHAAHAIDQVTNVLIAAGDFAAAEQYAQKGLAISTQLSGFDSQESAMHHMKLSILESELGNRTSALQHLLSAKYLLQLMSGERHTELATVYTRLAALYEEVGDFESVWQCYIKAKHHTCDLMAISALNIALASACSRNGHVFEALELQKQAYTMLKELIGDRDESQLAEVKTTLENYLRAVNEEKIASNQLVNERLKEMMEKANKLKLAPSTDSTTTGQQLSDQELLEAFAEIDARAEKERKKAEKAARLAKKPSGKAKK